MKKEIINILKSVLIGATLAVLLPSITILTIF